MVEYEYLSEVSVIHAEDVADIRRIFLANGIRADGLESARLTDVSRRSTVLVARETSSCGRRPIIGIACLSTIVTLTESVGIIGIPVVDPPYQPRGVAEELVRHLTERGLGTGLDRVENPKDACEPRSGRAHRTSCIRGILPPGPRSRRPASS